MATTGGLFGGVETRFGMIFRAAEKGHHGVFDVHFDEVVTEEAECFAVYGLAG